MQKFRRRKEKIICIKDGYVIKKVEGLKNILITEKI